MNTIRKLWINLLIAILSAAMVFVVMKTTVLEFPYNETYAGEGDIMTFLSTNQTVEIGMYSDDASGTTTLTGEDGTTVTTKPGVKVGYYETTATVPVQKYTVTGNGAYLYLDDQSQVINPSVQTRENKLTTDMMKLMATVGFFLAFVLHLTIPNHKSNRTTTRQ